MSFFQRIQAKLSRDQHLPVKLQVRKGVVYLHSLLTAHWYLREVQHVGQGVRTIAAPRIDNQGTMTLGQRTVLRSLMVPVELATAHGAQLIIGHDCSLNYGVSIGCTGSIQIGDRVRMGPYVMVIDSPFHDVYDRNQRPPPQAVVIEDDVWLGARACIMPGVRIGRGAVVGTCAVVTKDVAPFTVVAGIPAKVIQQLDPEKFRS